ncbi:MAG TPA: segregation/condensation protein A [Nitrospirota bacterium]|nr:segregation/condensation protein A [Nitrospirota bacterium]
MSYEVKLEVFEGPLDLLLHLIKKHEVNIYDIPISLVTQQYLEYIDIMKDLNLEIAGEFLLMAATLTHIKSKMLLPVEEKAGEDEETEDPRAELIRKLLEYKSFKEVAEELGQREDTWRDIFYNPPDKTIENDEVFIEVGLFDLLEAFRDVISKIPDNKSLDIEADELTVRGRMTTIIERLDLAATEGVTLLSLLEDGSDGIEPIGSSQGKLREKVTRRNIVVTFLALLELARIRLIKLMQASSSETIRVYRNEDNQSSGHPEFISGSQTMPGGGDPETSSG